MNLWGEVKGASASGVLAGGHPFAKNTWYVGAGSPLFGKRVGTIAEAFAIMEPKDVLIIGPQTHAEGNLVIPATLDRITIIGAGARGDAWISPPNVGDEGLQILAPYVTLMNVGVSGEATADYALNVVGVEGFRAFGCKFEGPDGTCVLIGGTADAQCSFMIIDDCEFAFCGSGILFDNSGFGFPTQITLKNSLFHDQVTVCVGDGPTGGGVLGLVLTDNVFDTAEDGTEPTDFIKVDRAGDSGIISGNRFAIATNDTAKLTIAAAVHWVANATEAGWSTARPA